MTVEEKALALVKKARQFCTSSMLVDVLCRDLAGELEHAIEREQAAIEAHEADKKAFSDVVLGVLENIAHRKGCDVDVVAFVRSSLSPFILPDPEPDPLEEILAESMGYASPVRADRLRTALAARGYKIERIEQ